MKTIFLTKDTWEKIDQYNVHFEESIKNEERQIKETDLLILSFIMKIVKEKLIKLKKK